MARPLVIPILGNTQDLEAALIRSGVVAEDASKKIQGSFRAAGVAAADEAKKMGASVDVQTAAAGRAAAAFTEMSAKITTAQRNAGKAAATAAGAVGASVDEQRAAYTKAIAVQSEYEAAVSKAATAAKAASAEQAAAAEEAAAKIAAASEKQAAAVEATQKKFSSLGKYTLGAGIGISALSVKGAIDLQRAMEQIHTQAGATQQQVTQMTAAVLKMSPGLATGPQALADSLYHAFSATRNMTQSLNIMSAAAKESKISGADLTDTTTALTAAVFSGIGGAKNFSQAMGLLNATAGAGDMKFQDLNEAFAGPMLAVTKGYGLSLKDVGAALATFGDLNIRGADAATQLRMAVQYMAKPAATAGPLLEKLGLNTHSFANAMANGGLMPALQLLHQRLDAVGVKGNQMAQVIGDLFTKKGASGVTILENSLDRLGSKYKQVGEGASKQNAAWEATQQTLAFQMDQLKATIAALADKFGTYLIPKLQAAGNAIKDVIAWMGKHKQAAEDLAIAIGSVLAAAITVFAYTKAVQFIGATRDMIGGMSKVASYMTGGLIPTLGRTEAANATAGASFTAVGTDAAAGAAEVEAGTAAMAAAATEADATIEADNAAAGTSFTAMLGPIGLATAAIAGLATGYNALATNFGAQGTAAVGGLQKSSGHALNQGQLKGLLASTGAIGTTGKHGAWPWTPDNISLINASDKALKQFAGSGNAGLLDAIIARAEKLKKTWPQDSSALNTLVGVMNKAKQEGLMSPASSLLGGAQSVNANPSQQGGAVPVPTSGSNAQRIAGALKGQGFSNVAIAGILGNFAQETGGGNLNAITPNATGPSGLGIEQDTGSRRAGLNAYAAARNESPTSLVAQIGYLVQELRTNYHNVFAKLQNAPNAAAAAKIFDASPAAGGFEGGTDPGGIREKAAQQAMSMLAAGGGGGLGNAGLNALLDSGKGKKPKAFGIPAGVENMLHLAEQLEGAPYSKANHAGAYNETIAQIKKFGTDCSGLVSVLLKEGVTGIRAAQTTQGLPTSAGLSKGTGRYVTVYDRHTGPVQDEHTIIDILGHYFESGGNKKYNPAGGVSMLTAKQAAGELSGGGFEAFHPTNLNSPVRGGSTANAPGNNTAMLIAQFEAAVTAALVKAGTSLLQKYSNMIQSGTIRSLSAGLGENTSHVVSPTGAISGQFGLTTPGTAPGTVNSLLHQRFEQLGLSTNMRQITGVSGGIVAAGAQGSTQDKAYQSEVTNLLADGQKQLADKLVAAHKQAMQALGEEMYAQQSLKDAESLQLQATTLKDQTTMQANYDADTLNVAKAQYQLANDQAAAQVQAVKDMSTVVQDQFAGMVQAVQDHVQMMSDAANAVVTGIQDQTQIQVDTFGERGLYGLNLVAQKLQVQLDQQKASDDQQIAVAQQNLDAVTATWNATVSGSQISLDQLTAQQDALVAQSQAAADLVTIQQDQRIATAQQKMDMVTLHQDVSVIGPAQTAVDLNANAPKAQQDVFAAVLKKATGAAGVAEGQAGSAYQSVYDNAQGIIAQAGQSVQAVQNAANSVIGSAQANLTTVTGEASYYIGLAQGTLTGAQNQAALNEAPLSSGVAVTQAQASTQFAGSGLQVNIYGVPLENATALGTTASWALRQLIT